MNKYVIELEKLSMKDIGQVGGKNASLGEMISTLSNAGVLVPGGFATTADAYWEFLQYEGLEERINNVLSELDVDDVKRLAETGEMIRQWVLEAPFPDGLEQSLRAAYAELENRAGENVAVAVRSSATAEDLPDASFAGQQETFLNIRGIENVLERVKKVFASLYNDRAIAYRVHKGFEHADVALSAGIQRMVRSDLAASGVMFTLDTESGFEEAVFITSSYGLGEMIVQGTVNPDEFYTYKPNLCSERPAILRRHKGEKAIKMVLNDDQRQPTQVVDVPEEERIRFSLTDEEVESLGRIGITIEKHYGRPMDIEWGKDGVDGQLYILQARPETVKSNRKKHVIERYMLKEHSEVLVTGRSIGQKIGSGKVRIIKQIADMDELIEGEILVTDMTDPDWEPVMKRASAIVTNRGGRTCHAAIIARELGIPAVVGTNDATEKLTTGQEVTVSCAEGDTGYVYDGLLDYEIKEISLGNMPEIPVRIMLNVGNPERAFDFSSYPNHGIGLARLEFIISQMIGIHPRALIEYATMPPELQKTIEKRITGYADPVTFYEEKLVEGISTLAAAFAPKPVIVRLSDFKSNEYSNLLGGKHFEPREENPMLGFRGAARYISEQFKECFKLECRALHRVRQEMGFTHVKIMVPFVRTVEQASAVVDLLAENGLKRGDEGLEIMMMCEIPSNVLLAEEFLQLFDGFSVGSNDLTQLTLGIDRDSSLVADSFDERNPAVKKLLGMAIEKCNLLNKYIGICGQGPSDHPDLAEWLLEQNITSISLNPDSVLETWFRLAGEKF